MLSLTTKPAWYATDDATGSCRKGLGSFQPRSRCHKGRQDIWGNLAKQRSGTSTFQAKTYSGLAWMWGFFSISWMSLFYYWERWWPSRQTGQIGLSLGHEFVSTLCSVVISHESYEQWETSFFHPQAIQKHSTNSVQIQWRFFLKTLSATLQVLKDVPKNNQHYTIQLRFPFLWT